MSSVGSLDGHPELLKGFLCPLFHLEATVLRVCWSLTYFPGNFLWLGRKEEKKMISRQWDAEIKALDLLLRKIFLAVVTVNIDGMTSSIY